MPVLRTRTRPRFTQTTVPQCHQASGDFIPIGAPNGPPIYLSIHKYPSIDTIHSLSYRPSRRQNRQEMIQNDESQHRKRTPITNATIADPDAPTTLFVADELKPAPLLAPFIPCASSLPLCTPSIFLRPQNLQRSHDDPDRMAPTHRIRRLAQIRQELLVRARLDGSHGLFIDL